MQRMHLRNWSQHSQQLHRPALTWQHVNCSLVRSPRYIAHVDRQHLQRLCLKRASSAPGHSSAATSAAPNPVEDAPETMHSFWLQQHNLPSYQVDRLVSELGRRADPRYRSTAWLSQRLAQLEQVLPGSAAPLVYTHSELLDADVTKLPQQLVDLKEALPGVNVWSLVQKAPRLLMYPVDKIKQAIALLVKLYRYKSPNKKAEVLKLASEYPELLYRMEYYLNAKTAEDLPVDLQNRLSRSHCG